VYLRFKGMNTSTNIAKHFKEVYFGGNWTVSNLKDNLKDVSWQEAIKKVGDLNTIATLVFHIHYFVKVAAKVLEGAALEGKDELSFAHPPINSQKDWDTFLESVYKEGEHFVALIQKFPDQRLFDDFTDPKYGIYYRQLHGIIEHTHYHLGQIAIIKKMVKQL
jgi:hypothetical protein